MKNLKTLLIAFALIDFTAVSIWLVADLGPLAFFSSILTDGWTLQVALDLVLALSLFVGWMWKDARARDLNPLPYALLVLGTGSIGALGYLLRRELAPAPRLAPAAA